MMQNPETLRNPLRTCAHARYGSTPIANPRNPQTLYIGKYNIYLYTGYWGVFLGICVGPHRGFATFRLSTL